MYLGADPSDMSSLVPETGSSWGDMVHYSPVHYAADLHMADVLKILLEPARLRGDLEALLRQNYRAIGVGRHSDQVLPLYWVVGEVGKGRYHQLLVHCGDQGRAYKDTIKLLCSLGADPLKISRRFQRI
jgi:hypothetical protein